MASDIRAVQLKECRGVGIAVEPSVNDAELCASLAFLRTSETCVNQFNVEVNRTSRYLQECIYYFRVKGVRWSVGCLFREIIMNLHLVV